MAIKIRVSRPRAGGKPITLRGLAVGRSQVTKSYKEFENQLTELIENLGGSVESFQEEVTNTLFVDIVRHTPVDTGEAAGEWQMGNQYNNGRTGKKFDPRAEAVLIPEGVDYGKQVHIFNNAPHIQFLEFGSSDQSPQGMIRVSIERMKRRLPRIAAKYGIEATG